MRSMFDETNIKLSQSKLQDMLNQAQQEADTRLIEIAVCVSDKNLHCVNQGSNVIMFLNHYQDGQLHENSQLIAKLQINKDDEMKMRSFPYYRHYLQYQPHVLSHADNGTWWYCHKSKAIWAIAVNRAEHTRVLKPDQNGQILDSQGKSLECGGSP